MGCDINLHVEIKISSKLNEWIHYSHPRVSRSYTLFSILAGVRNEENNIDAIFKPRGIPEDISDVTRIDFNQTGDDQGSASYLSPDELLKCMDFFEELFPGQEYKKGSVHESFGFLFGGNIWHFNKFKDDFPEELIDARVVFWFEG